MHDWLGTALIGLGVGLLVSGFMKRLSRLRMPLPAGSIRPEFAAMGNIVRSIIMLFVGVVALKTALFYFLFGGERFLSPLDFAGIMFVLGAYIAWIVLATKRRPVLTTASDTVNPDIRATASAR